MTLYYGNSQNHIQIHCFKLHFQNHRASHNHCKTTLSHALLIHELFTDLQCGAVAPVVARNAVHPGGLPGLTSSISGHVASDLHWEISCGQCIYHHISCHQAVLYTRCKVLERKAPNTFY